MTKNKFQGDSGSVQDVKKDVVIRNIHYWSPTVRDLLVFLEQKGFPYSPKHLGFDKPNHTERLRLIKGDSGKDVWEKIVTDEGLTAYARLLRSYHDTVADYRPHGKVLWAFGEQKLQDDEIICHNDFGPWNTVWRDNKPIGILDWDLAAPGKPIDDIAYALEYSAPFRDDETCLKWCHFSIITISNIFYNH